MVQRIWRSRRDLLVKKRKGCFPRLLDWRFAVLGVLSAQCYVCRKFAGNVRGQLPSGKNPEYLMVTGAISPGPTTTNTRQGACLLYVFDVNEGVFAAYAFSWMRAAESAMQPQSGSLVPVGGGQIRAPLPVKK